MNASISTVKLPLKQLLKAKEYISYTFRIACPIKLIKFLTICFRRIFTVEFN